MNTEHIINMQMRGVYNKTHAELFSELIAAGGNESVLINL